MEARPRYWVTVAGPFAATVMMRHVIMDIGLDLWVGVRWIHGDTWSLWWDNVMLWAGTMPDQDAWRDALLEFWWGQGGGCC
ncbi:MAG: hypothetical protein OWU33_16085 [Firmicutes bacterium]|nr:hypothetical protein [Bacillota bacterium]